MSTKPGSQSLLKPHTSHRLLAYLKKQPVAHATLHEVQKTLSHSDISLSRRVSEDWENRGRLKQ